LLRAYGEVGLPGGSLHFYKANFQAQRFFPLSRDTTVMVNGEFGFGNGYGGKPLPFFRNFFAGGIGSVRGYKTATLGPRDVDASGNPTDEVLGGNRRLVGTVEFLTPLPGLGLDRSLRIGAFIDGGQVWGSGQKLSLGDMRYSTGLSVAWSSPLGPLKFSIAQPINKKSGDKSERFQFQMGTTF